MIVCISGGVGSGKSLSAIHYALRAAEKNRILTNFTLLKVKNYHRLRRNDIILETSEVPEGCRKEKVTRMVNWDFWEENKKADVFLDEIHNLVNSRNAMSKQNILMSEWLSQIRKIWGSSGDQNVLDMLQGINNNSFNKVWMGAMLKSRNLIYITQRPRKADINWRDLTHVWIKCRKRTIGKTVLIFNYIWFGDDNMDAFESAEMGVKPKIHFFVGNGYFNRYDSYEIVRSQGEYL